MVFPDGHTAVTAKYAITQKEKELHAETLVVQPSPASSSSQPPVGMDTLGMSDLNTLPVIHTKEPSYHAGQPLPTFNNIRRRFIRGSEYESHKQRRLSYNLNAHDTGAQAGGSSQELPGPVELDDVDMP